MAAATISYQYLPVGNFPIKSTVAVDQGDLVGLDSNGQVNLADSDAIVDAVGFAVFEDAPGVANNTRTGDSGLTQRCTIYRGGIVQGAKGMSGMTIGAPVYLSATAATYTQTKPSGTTDIIAVGTAIAADTVAVLVPPALLKLQASGNSTVAFI